MKNQPKRAALVERIMWNSGGTGFGLCRLAGMMLHQMQRPDPDWKSVVAISGPPEKYTDEELEKLADFSDRHTARYDQIFNVRAGANAICIDKVNHNCWMRKRMSWEYGPMHSTTLDQAIEVFEREYGSKPKEGQIRQPAKT
jgi:hypothetical protein